MEGRATERNAWIFAATVLFAIFSLLAMIAGAVDVMNPIYPWGYRLPIFGEVALLIGMLSLVATALLWRLKRLGGYLGIVSFVVAFAVNVYVGEHPILHVVAGVLAGLLLLLPLALGWKRLSG